MILFTKDKEGLFYNQSRGFWIENITSDNLNDLDFLDYCEDVDEVIIGRIRKLTDNY